MTTLPQLDPNEWGNEHLHLLLLRLHPNDVAAFVEKLTTLASLSSTPWASIPKSHGYCAPGAREPPSSLLSWASSTHPLQWSVGVYRVAPNPSFKRTCLRQSAYLKR